MGLLFLLVECANTIEQNSALNAIDLVSNTTTGDNSLINAISMIDENNFVSTTGQLVRLRTDHIDTTITFPELDNSGMFMASNHEVFLSTSISTLQHLVSPKCIYISYLDSKKT